MIRAAVLIAVAVAAPLAAAEVPGVAALLAQARYWQGRNRPDLAADALRRVLVIDPTNAVARRGVVPARAPVTPKPPAVAPARVAAAPKPVVAAAAAPRPVAARPAQSADPGGDARAAGFRSLDAGDLDAAARNFTRAIAVRSNDTDALGGLGVVRLRQAQFAKARDLLSRASVRGQGQKWAEALASARAFATLGEARVAAESGDTATAARLGESLANGNNPARAAATELLAGVYQRQGRFTEAAEAYKSAGSTPSLQRRAGHAEAEAAAAAGNDGEAEGLFQQAMLADTADPWVRYDYARFLDSRGRRSEAIAVLAVLGRASDNDSMYAAALLNSQFGRDAAAAALLDRIPVARRTPEMRSFAAGLKTDAAIDRARQLSRQGETAAALSSLRQLAGTPGLPMAKQGAVASALYDLGDTSGGTALATRALATGSNEPADYEAIVRILAASGQDEAAAAAVERARTVGGGGGVTVARLSAALVVAQADRLREAGQYGRAFDRLKEAWASSPNNAAVLLSLARLYEAGGMTARAARTYQLVLAQAPGDKSALIGLIGTAAGAGDQDMARDALARAIKADPSDYNIYLAAARMEKARGNTGASSRYLKQARMLYLRQTGVDDGGFGSSNPFADSEPLDDPFAMPASRKQIDPFALDDEPLRRKTDGEGDRGRGRGRSSGDPVLAGIDADLRNATEAEGPRADIRANYRRRSGESGLSQLDDVGVGAEVSTGLAGGRISAKATAVALDAGAIGASARARFGRNATEEAQSIVDERESNLATIDTQHASGVAVQVAYENGLVKADAGTTPLGFGRTRAVGGVTLTPRLSPSVTSRVWGERRPVTDSIVAYAGTRDPVSGARWGAVDKTGGGASLSYDVGGTGVYADGAYHRYTGQNIRKNNGFQANFGGYTRVLKSMRSTASIGINANYQSYANNQNFFTFGHGGYFSPQSFISVSFPASYSYRAPGGLEIDANASPGYQNYSQHAEPLYPTDAAAQAQLDALKLLNTDVRSTYDGITQTGFGLSAGGSVYYPLNPRMKVGGDLNLNTFGQYNEFRATVGIKQIFGGQ